MRRLALSSLLLAATMLTGTAATAATTPSTTTPALVATTWSQITDAHLNIDEVGVARTADGVLHVAWRRRGGAGGKDEIVHAPFRAAGGIGTATAASPGWAAAGNPDLVVLPNGGLRVFFAGLTGSNSTLDGVQSASAGADGTTWTTQGSRVSSTTSAVPEGVGAAVLADGTPVFAYAHSLVLGFHVGLDPARADLDLLEGTKCCAYHPDVVVTPDGTATLGWYSNVTGEEGLWVQPMLPSLGTKQRVPDSVGADGKGLSLAQRMPMVARGTTNDVFVAYCSGYPTCSQVLLWKVGSATPVTVATGRDIEAVNVASDPSGRLWVMWEDATSLSVHAVRMNADATAPGGIVDFAVPPGTSIVWKLKGNANDEALDVFASVTTPTALATWHGRVLPGLDVDAVRKGRRVTFKVTDAGTPLAGVKVKLGRANATTDRKGRAVVAGRAGDATLTKSGYSPRILAA